ncbi:Lipopolysaccharide export system protein LptA [Serratia symbiotica]|nr:Lipopolysaccharide export system protein LptA [Serratia symbiotica]
MKFKIKKPLQSLVIAHLVFVISPPVLALKSDVNQPVLINSLKQSVDMQHNVSTFTYDVVIQQGTIDIRAAQVVVTHLGDDQGKTYIEAFGDPVTFYQIQDSGKPVKGHAQKLRYDVFPQLLTLTGNAYLEQLDSNVKSDSITYMLQHQQIKAISDKGKHVTTVLVPSQMQEKNG